MHPAFELEEIQFHIAQYLDQLALTRASVVSRSWYNIFNKHLWFQIERDNWIHESFAIGLPKNSVHIRYLNCGLFQDIQLLVPYCTNLIRFTTPSTTIENEDLYVTILEQNKNS